MIFEWTFDCQRMPRKESGGGKEAKDIDKEAVTKVCIYVIFSLYVIFNY